MIALKDRYSLGIIIGLIANIFSNIFNYIVYQLDLTQYLPRQIAAATFIPLSKIDSLIGIIIGVCADYGVAIFFSLSIVYLLDITGDDFAILKGLSIALLHWLLLFGLLLRFGLSRINPSDLGTNLIFLFNHLLLGVLIAIMVVKYKVKYFR